MQCALTGLLWGCSHLGISIGCETVHLSVSSGQCSRQGSQALHHILQVGTFIRTRQFLSRIELGWWLWLWLSPILDPPPPPTFLGIERRAVFLDLGAIVVIEQNKLERSSLLCYHTSSEEKVPIFRHWQAAKEESYPHGKRWTVVGQRRAHDRPLTSG